ncbi:MAG: thioredoxin domain-containing protein [Deltaproteobacteria bacterium]|nr:thioredoxin domain-containing protein [Deltaproteobacteria bacterium]
MARAKKRDEAVNEGVAPRVPPVVGLSLLLVLGLGLSLLALFQWAELLISLAGGEISCAIDERFNCAQVWTSPVAIQIHTLTGVPVAGWGLVYGLSVFGLTVLLVRSALLGRSLAPGLHALRLFAGVGVLVSIALFLITVQLGTYCLTCIATYCLVGAFAAVAFRLRPEQPFAQVGAAKVLGPAAALIVGAWVVLLFPGSRTPHERVVDLGTKKVAPPPAGQPPPPPPPGDALGQFLANLPPQGRQAVADGLLEFKNGRPPPSAVYASRLVIGPRGSKVHLLDWSDLRCGHCRHLSEVMAQLEEEAPGAFSHESRWFPLDGTCNPKVPPNMTDPTKVRCDGAKAMICMEGEAGYGAVRRAVFLEQQTITMDRLFQLAQEKAKVERRVLEACIVHPDTQKKLAEDIEYAARYDLQGTPLLLVNGRSVHPVAPFLYAMILAQGDPSAPSFSALPPGQAHDHSH